MRLALTPELAQKIVQRIRVSGFFERAIVEEGVRSEALEWMRKGRQDVLDGVVSTYSLFVTAIDKAQAELESDLQDSIHAAGAKDWRAHAWLLERISSRRFGVRKMTESQIVERVDQLISDMRGVMSPEGHAELINGLVALDAIPIEACHANGEANAKHLQ